MESLAAEWSLLPELKLALEYDDNYRMSQFNPKEEYRAQISPIVRIDRKTETSNTRLDVQFQSNKYKEELNSNDSKFMLTSNSKLERNLLGIDLGYIRDTTLTSELEPDGTGRVDANARRKKAYIKPYWQYTLGERSMFRLSYDGSDINYDVNEYYIIQGISQLQDYNYQDASSVLSYQWSERVKLNFILSASRYKTSGPVNFVTSDTYSGQVGLDYHLSETVTSALTLGIRDTEQKQSIKINNLEVELPGVDASGNLYSVKLNKEFEKTTTGLTVSRVLSPSSTGRLDVSDRLDLSLKHQINHTVTLFVSAYASESQNAVKSSGLDLGEAKRHYYIIRPRISWKLDRNWSTGFEYSYRRYEQETPLITGDVVKTHAEANKIMWSVNYKMSKFTTAL